MTPLRRLLAAIDHTRRLLDRPWPPVQFAIRWGALLIAYPAIAVDDDRGCDCEDCTTDPGLGDGHIPGEGCPCEPIDIAVPADDGTITFVTVHRLDPDAPPEQQADRAAAVFEACEAARRDLD